MFYLLTALLLAVVIVSPIPPGPGLVILATGFLVIRYFTRRRQ